MNNPTNPPAQKPEELRVGVFVCHCGLNIAGTVDVHAVAEYAKTIPDVVYVKENRYTCADPGQDEIRKAIKQQKLNRVVIAACCPRMHEPTFREQSPKQASTVSSTKWQTSANSLLGATKATQPQPRNAPKTRLKWLLPKYD